MKKNPNKPELTQLFVQEIFDYKDGFLYWKRKGVGIKHGQKAGTSSKQKYGFQLSVRINKERYLIHRVIFLWHHGYMPDEIDHIDRDNLNNKIENLRAATRSQNNANRRHKPHSSKFMGVHLSQGKYWCAMIKINGKTTHIGYFKSESEAALAYNQYAIKHHGEFANLNQI